jgi:hypothetical protein
VSLPVVEADTGIIVVDAKIIASASGCSSTMGTPITGNATTQVKGGAGGQGLGGDVRVRVGIHKILVHLQVYAGKERETYYERLHDVPPDPDNNKAKVLETVIEISGNHYQIKAYVYPNGKIIVDVPCSSNPFPIWLQDREKTNKDFLCLLAMIRAFLLQDKIRDCHNRIIPPTHNPCWRVKNCDIHFDIPTFAINLQAFPDMQAKQFFNVAVSRIYAKMINANPYIRFEKACQHLDAPITDNIGSVIIDEAIRKS